LLRLLHPQRQGPRVERRLANLAFHDDRHDPPRIESQEREGHLHLARRRTQRVATSISATTAFLYISTGDGASPNPPDILNAGQDLTTPLSKILRIDVDREENGKAYAIPPDNPFVKDARRAAGNMAYGFRNPWRMSFDRQTAISGSATSAGNSTR